jgi:hypothetical protein
MRWLCVVVVAMVLLRTEIATAVATEPTPDQVHGHLVCLPLTSSGWSPAKQQVDKGDLAVLKTAPLIDGDTYECGQMIRVVNHLRRLGKDKSLATLREYLEKNDGEHPKVHVFCRLLFANPKGWRPPGLGGPDPEVNAEVAKQFPLFPMAISNGVPFLVIRGYNLGGVQESAWKSLKLCESLSLIEKDYPLAGYEQAAWDLLQTNSLRDLYKLTDSLLTLYVGQGRPTMAGMILRQAIGKNEQLANGKEFSPLLLDT